MSISSRRSRLYALIFSCCVAAVTIVVWRAVRPYEHLYFFPVHFLVGLSVPFFVYAMGGTRYWFWAGVMAGGAALFWLNFMANEIAPSASNWAHFGCGAIGLVLAACIQMLYRQVYCKHPAYTVRPQVERSL